VCPLVEEPEEGDGGAEGARAATAELLRLRAGELQGHDLALLHGAMRPAEKQHAMAAFASGTAQVLVATTVIEVGIDVPNATVMLIENADRFGISQLHQLRGRVGRGEHPAACFLVAPAGGSDPGQPGSARLRALVEHADGFRLAEIDLRLRREGELAGTRQSGLARHRVASLPEDAELLERARARAQAIVAADAELLAPEHALLGDALAARFGPQAREPIPA
jgi:ATP-dependent DNA helicase RecG